MMIVLSDVLYIFVRYFFDQLLFSESFLKLSRILYN